MSGLLWIRIGAISMALAVAAGAFGAHGLKAKLEATSKTAVFETAVRYHVYHALALVAVGLVGLHAGRGTALRSRAGRCLSGRSCSPGASTA